MAKQRLIMLFDGTWNDPEDQTNVYRISRCLHDYDGDMRQRFFYNAGVGTSKLERFRGGVFGYGLSKNLLAGYEWLAKRYTDGEEIWIFGFSRGAYTARSLVGLIRKCGLLHIVTPGLLEKLKVSTGTRVSLQMLTSARISGNATAEVRGSTSSAYGIPSAHWEYPARSFPKGGSTRGTIPNSPALWIMPTMRLHWTNTGRPTTYHCGQVPMETKNSAIWRLSSAGLLAPTRMWAVAMVPRIHLPIFRCNGFWRMLKKQG